jgi:hypothetical protein
MARAVFLYLLSRKSTGQAFHYQVFSVTADSSLDGWDYRASSRGRVPLFAVPYCLLDSGCLQLAGAQQKTMHEHGDKEAAQKIGGDPLRRLTFNKTQGSYEADR